MGSCTYAKEISFSLFIFNSLIIVYYSDTDTEENFILHLNSSGDSLGSFKINGASPNFFHSIIRVYPFFDYAGFKYVLIKHVL